jgi:hypothetical protein
MNYLLVHQVGNHHEARFANELVVAFERFPELVHHAVQQQPRDVW